MWLTKRWGNSCLLWFQEINIGLVYVNLPVNSYLAFVPVCNYLAIFPTAYTPMELECHHLPPPRPPRQTVKTCQRSPWSTFQAKAARKRQKNRTMSWCQLWHWKCQIRIFKISSKNCMFCQQKKSKSVCTKNIKFLVPFYQNKLFSKPRQIHGVWPSILKLGMC